MSTGSSEVRAHTGEPWVIDETERSWLIGREDFDNDPIFYEVACVGGDLENGVSDVEKANAERIVACVNLLAGIPTAALLRQPTVAQSVPLIGELVDAATEAMAYLIDDINEEGRGGNAHILYLRLEKAVKAMKGVQS